MAQAAQRWDVVSEHAEPAGWVMRIALRKFQSPSSRLRRLVSPRTTPDRSRLPDPDVNDAFADLPYRLRVVLVARFYLGWSAQQIADSLRLPLRSVDRRLRRGLRRIERSLDGPS
jgi:RNA polymerase sigma factor (sigma-70 family)